jgi:hypothetical protein
MGFKATRYDRCDEGERFAKSAERKYPAATAASDPAITCLGEGGGGETMASAA